VTDLSPLIPLARGVIETCTKAGLKIAVAESCTGGLVAGVLTEISGSSAVVDRAFITYSDAAKTGMLGVPAALIDQFGAVSRETALAMVAGALARSDADIAVSITGIAGPTGGSAEKPVGLVHFGAMRKGTPARHLMRQYRNDGRAAIRAAAVKEALDLLLSVAQSDERQPASTVPRTLE
jgi:nicotinamide-nucleotide amidase